MTADISGRPAYAADATPKPACTPTVPDNPILETSHGICTLLPPEPPAPLLN